MKQFGIATGLSTRAASARVPKVQKSDGLINRFKRKLEDERRLLRTMKTMLSNEIESKNTLEKILRQCIEDVK